MNPIIFLASIQHTPHDTIPADRCHHIGTYLCILNQISLVCGNISIVIICPYPIH